MNTALASQSEFVLQIPRFEGPLDLLLYLIEKNKFTLENLEVCPIIDQYLTYVNRMHTLDVELASEFLDMASYLLWIKSCLLLPVFKQDGEEAVNPEHALKEMLAAYLAIKQAARELGQRPLLFRDHYPRGTVEPERSLSRMGLGALIKALEAIRERTRHYMVRDEGRRFSIREMMARLHAMLSKEGRIVLQEAATTGERTEIIALFMAALELSKNSVASLFQKNLFAKIYVVLRNPAG